MKRSSISLAVLAVVFATASAFVGKASRPYSNVYLGVGGMTNCNPGTCQATGGHACSSLSIWSDPACSNPEPTLTRKP